MDRGQISEALRWLYSIESVVYMSGLVGSVARFKLEFIIDLSPLVYLLDV